MCTLAVCLVLAPASCLNPATDDQPSALVKRPADGIPETLVPSGPGESPEVGEGLSPDTTGAAEPREPSGTAAGLPSSPPDAADESDAGAAAGDAGPDAQPVVGP